MKKVGFLINTLSKSGGTERVTCVLASELVASGYSVEIFCMFNSGDSFYKLDKRVLITNLLNKKEGTLKDYFSLFFSLQKHTKHLDYIIGVGMDLCIFTIPLKLFNKVRVIGWEHFNLGVKGPVVSLARLLGMRFAHGIVTLTHKDYEDYKGKTKSVRCIYNPITIDVAPIETYERKTVVSVGRLTSQKGYDMLLDIWAQTDAQHNNWKLVIVGDGDDEIALKKQAIELNIANRVSFIKATKDIVSHYKSASIYAMTSRYEGLPLVLIEAASIGLPIIAFNCETGPKEVVEDKTNGFLIPAFDKVSYLDNLQRLMADCNLRRRMGEQAVIHSGKFMKSKIVKQWTEILV